MALDMQIFTRDVRRMLRYERMRVMLGVRGCRSLSNMVAITVKMFIRRGRNPQFVMAKLQRTVGKTLRSLDEGTHGVSYRGLEQLIHLSNQINIMFAGSFHGRRCPDTTHRECAICISRGSGAWWRASRCGHCFHVQCISAHFEYDKRCPLCRVQLGAAV
jgi:hypothetical protein